MPALREEHRSGLDYLAAATSLLQEIRAAHPIEGLYEAGDLSWWWRQPRSSDAVDQVFWFDKHGKPEAAAIITDWGDRVALDPMLMPDATPDFVAVVVERGLANARKYGYETIELEVSQTDTVMRDILVDHGFAMTAEGYIAEAWLDTTLCPDVSELADGYRLTTRRDSLDKTHHGGRSGPEHSERLLQTPLYRIDLDLLVVDENDDPAAYGVFWCDPVTATGLVEPMRTEEAHQKRGLARHVLTAGIARLTEAGVERIKIVYETDNPASGHLYRSVGFEPVKITDAFTLGEQTQAAPG